MRRVLPAALAACALLGLAASANGATTTSRQYVVLFERGASVDAARAAIAAAGGTVVSVNSAIGTATVRASDASFAGDVARSSAIVGAAANQVIGKAPQDVVKRDRIEKDVGAAASGRTRAGRAIPGADPLAYLQWDMQMIHATPEGSYARQQGSKAVRVGVLDTGIDASHPDIAPNFDARLSRNFTVDDPSIDGDCAEEADKSCEDPATVDEDGHGTHVASTIGSPLNGIGIAGVAPKVDLVNLRAGQDSGYFFLGPTLDALTFAGDHGIDVVNMSYYIDPWLYNCKANSADSPAEQREQRLVIAVTQRAIDYARERGVTTIAAEGNGHTDLGKPTFDDSSPDYPVDENGDPADARPRTIDNSCLSMPTEANGVIGVTSVGPSKRKAYYSDYGVEQADVAAPGGDTHDTPDGSRRIENAILAAYPYNVGIQEDREGDGKPDIDPVTGEPTSAAVVKQGGAYYQWIQGTSMASPHAVGVAALIVAQYGHPDWRHGGLTLRPDRVERILKRTATDVACPAQEPFTYPWSPGKPPEDYTATCEGTPQFNGFYGEGIVDALAAVSRRGGWAWGL
jgi:lantibiotic leader peptide-processing serine protease